MNPGATARPLASTIVGASGATQISDSDNAIALDSNIRFDGRAAGAVVHGSAFNDDVECLGLSLSRRGQRDSKDEYGGE
jgi:hypothetical protein